MLMLLLFFSGGVMQLCAQPQKADTTGKVSRIKRWQAAIIKRITIKGSHPDSVITQTTRLANYHMYEGKYIRHLFFYQVPFGENIYDTLQKANKWQRRINRLHTNTRKGELDHFMFVREGQVVDPYRIADNERLLRDLPFIQDARIEALPTMHKDSVDLLVNTKDVFSISGNLRRATTSVVDAELFDNNFMGGAQRLSIGILWDKTRTPRTALGFSYTKYALGHSFVSIGVRHSSKAPSNLLANTYERLSGISLQRDLYTTKASWAGGLELMQAQSVSTIVPPDSVAPTYKMQQTDIWGGYNLRRGKADYRSTDYRFGSFLALRYIQRHFPQPSGIKDPVNPQLWYNTRSLISEISRYRINFTKTAYLLGFGRTEDIPYGHNYRLALGINQYENIRRFYTGIDLERLQFDRKNNYFTYRLAMGGNLTREKRWEDKTLFINGQFISALKKNERCMHRFLINANVAMIFDRRTYGLLGLNNSYGIQYFSADTLLGNRRMSLEAQHYLFTPWKPLGFQVGFVHSAEAALIAREGKKINKGDGFMALGTGIRFRNEQLIFGTVEARAFYFPRTVTGNSLYFRISTNLQIRYTGSFVRAPQGAFIQ